MPNKSKVIERRDALKQLRRKRILDQPFMPLRKLLYGHVSKSLSKHRGNCLCFRANGIGFFMIESTAADGTEVIPSRLRDNRTIRDRREDRHATISGTREFVLTPTYAGGDERRGDCIKKAVKDRVSIFWCRVRVNLCERTASRR